MNYRTHWVDEMSTSAWERSRWGCQKVGPTDPYRQHPGIDKHFTAQYLARTYPCQRFSHGITATTA